MSANWRQSVLASYPAGADLSALQFTFVKLDTSGNVIAVAAATDIPVGVLQNQPKLGQTAEVLVIGGSKIKASAAIALPALIGTTATGTAVKLVPGTDLTKFVLGQAEGDQGIAAAANDVITAFINCASPARAV